MKLIWVVLVAAAGALSWLFRNSEPSLKKTKNAEVVAEPPDHADDLGIAGAVTAKKIDGRLSDSSAGVLPHSGGETELRDAAALKQLDLVIRPRSDVLRSEAGRCETGDITTSAPPVEGIGVHAISVQLVEGVAGDAELSNGSTLSEEDAYEIEIPVGEASLKLGSSGGAERTVQRVEVTEGMGNGNGTQPLHPEPAQDSVEESHVPRVPQRYRPPIQKPPSRQTDKQNGKRESRPPAPSEVISGIRVRLSLDRFGFCSFSLLPERPPDLDEEVSVTIGDQQSRLFAQEVWYQDLAFPNAATELRQGLELLGRLADGRRARWLLTGRDLYVLASHQRATGFISTNRLALGRSHVVLCVTEIVGAVEAILGDAGCSEYTKLGESEGVPPGWIALRDVLPVKAIPLGPGSDPLYAIKPAPDIEIEFDGGLWLQNSVWLAGYPPRIKLLGELNVGARILIDDKEAVRAEDGSLTVDGYDVVGQHTIYVEGLSCSASYAIEEAPTEWEQWPAHLYGQAAVCGPLVELQADSASSRIISVPMSNPVLLGALPGQIFYCSRRSVARWKGYVPFEPVWALPSYPLTSNKQAASIIQLSDTPVAARSRTARAMLSWSNVILDASRKGLRIEHESPELRACWNAYKKVARSIWRAAR